MKIEEAIQQGKPMQPLQRAVVNLMYTYHWHLERMSALMKPFDLTPQQYNVMRIIRGRHPGSVSVGEVKAVMLDRNPDLTRLCDRLVQKSWLERQVNPKNRREVLLHITAAGLTLLDRMEQEFEQQKNQWQSISDEEANLLSDLLDRLRG
jgi:MarR family transcriptional regulator, 2-MHQ and catechol-resistance regulon repressor